MLPYKENSKKICEEIFSPSFLREMPMSAFLLTFKANYLVKMYGYPHFSLWIPNCPSNNLFFPHGPKLEQEPLYLADTVLKNYPNCQA